MTHCCFCWESDEKYNNFEEMNFVDDIIITSEDGNYKSRPKKFITESIRINSTTFFIQKKSLDGKVNIILTFYDSPEKPVFVRGFMYVKDKEYIINNYINNTISLYN